MPELRQDRRLDLVLESVQESVQESVLLPAPMRALLRRSSPDSLPKSSRVALAQWLSLTRPAAPSSLRRPMMTSSQKMTF